MIFCLILCILSPLHHATAFPMIFSGAPLCSGTRSRLPRCSTGERLSCRRTAHLQQTTADSRLPGRFGTNRWFIPTPNGMTREEPSIGVHSWSSPAWSHEFSLLSAVRSSLYGVENMLNIAYQAFESKHATSLFTKYRRRCSP